MVGYLVSYYVHRTNLAGYNTLAEYEKFRRIRIRIQLQGLAKYPANPVAEVGRIPMQQNQEAVVDN
jgi:hypothetical protein